MLVGELGATYWRFREYSDGEKILNQAISLAPDVAINYTDKASLYYSWRADTAMARATLEMSPSQNNEEIRWGWFWLRVYERNYPDALGQLALMPPDSISPKTQLAGMIYDLSGDSGHARACYDSSLVILERTVKELPDDPFGDIHSSLGLTYAGLGRKDDAIREGKRGVELFPVSRDAVDGVDRLKNLSEIYVRVGEYNAALDVIEQLLSIPGKFSIPLLRLYPWYDPLRKLPRYQKLVEKYGT